MKIMHNGNEYEPKLLRWADSGHESIMLMNTGQGSALVGSVAMQAGEVQGLHAVDPQLVDALEEAGVVSRTGEFHQGAPVCQVLIEPAYRREQQADDPVPPQRDFERDR
jgi:hypothetical protein